MSLESEKRMRHVAGEILSDHFVAEMMPFYFREDGRDFMEKAPLVYVKNLVATTIDYLSLHLSYV